MARKLKITLLTDASETVLVSDDYELPVLDDLQWFQAEGEDGTAYAVPVVRIGAIALEARPEG